METPNDEIARLDMAARAEVGEAVASRLRWILLFLSVFIAALAFVSEPPFYETLFVRTLAVFAVLTTVVLWSNWRYKLYLPALFFLSSAIGGAFFWGRPSHTTFDWIDRLGVPVGFFALPTYYFWKQAGLFATVNAPGWEREQSLVNGWRQVLMTPDIGGAVVEFSTGSFWTGYFTYRLMSPGPYWAIAKFKKGNMHRLVEFRVRELSAVTFTALPTGEMMVRIGNRTMRAATVPPPGFGESPRG